MTTTNRSQSTFLQNANVFDGKSEMPVTGAFLTMALVHLWSGLHKREGRPNMLFAVMAECMDAGSASPSYGVTDNPLPALLNQ